VAALGHQHRELDVGFGEVGEPGVTELVQRPAVAGGFEYLGGPPVGQPGPAGAGVEVGQGWLAGRGGGDVGEEQRALAPTVEVSGQEAGGLDLRVEQILPAQPGRVYPRCTAGRRAGSPEDWDGPWAFLERTQPYLVLGAIVRAAQIVSQLLDGDDEDVAGIAEHRDQLAGLLPLLGLERFDRRALNQALARCAGIVTEGSRQ